MPYLNNEKIELKERSLDRLKFKRLYSEQLIDKNKNNIVELGDVLNYKIIIKNRSKKDYEEDLIVTEFLSEYVEYESHYENKEIISFNYDKNRTLSWKIGKLKNGSEIVLNYLVKVTSGKSNDIINSTGFFKNIPTSKIKNTIGINLNGNQKEVLIKYYEKLKSKYNGKKLINEIYKESFNTDIKFDEFDITKLIINTQLDTDSIKTLYLNKNHSYYKIILNKCWSSIALFNHKYTNGQNESYYGLKSFGAYDDPERRRDYIYLETFKTGDILIYKN